MSSWVGVTKYGIWILGQQLFYLGIKAIKRASAAMWFGLYQTSQGPFICLAELVWEVFLFYLEHGPRLFVMDSLD